MYYVFKTITFYTHNKQKIFLLVMSKELFHQLNATLSLSNRNYTYYWKKLDIPDKISNCKPRCKKKKINIRNKSKVLSISVCYFSFF